MKKIFVLNILVLLQVPIFFSTDTFAQDKSCGDSFISIKRECLVQRKDKFKDSVIPISKSLRDQVYFTGTSSKKPVKFQVNSIFQSKTECTVYLDYGVFENENQDRI